MRETPLPCFVFSRSARETGFRLVEVSLGWLCELLGQDRLIQGRQAVSKPKEGKVSEIKYEDEKPKVCTDPGLV